MPSLKSAATRTITVPVDLIDAVEGQPEHRIEPQYMEGLTANIKENGLANPIQLVKKPDGRYLCADGNRRVEAHRKLGLKGIKSVVWGSGRENSKEAADLAGELLKLFNSVTKPWSPKEKWLSAIQFGPIMGTQTKNVLHLAGEWYGWVGHPTDPNRRVPALPAKLGRPGRRQIEVRKQSSPDLFKTARKVADKTWDLVVQEHVESANRNVWYKECVQWLVEQNAQRDVGVYMTANGSIPVLRNAIMKGKVCPQWKRRE